MLTPWDLDSMRSDAELPFVSRAVPVEGVQPSEGHVVLGMGYERTLGAALHSGFVTLGTPWVSLRYALMVGNGNGQNQILPDNNPPAGFGRAGFPLGARQGPPPARVSAIYSVTDEPRKPLVHLGVAAQWRKRTGGNLPDLITETDTGAAADFAASFY